MALPPDYPEFVDEHDRKLFDAVISLCWATINSMKKENRATGNAEVRAIKAVIRAMGYTDKRQAEAVFEYIDRRLS